MKLIRKPRRSVSGMSAKSQTNDDSSSSSRSVATTATEPASGWAEGRRRRGSATSSSPSPPSAGAGAGAGNDDDARSVSTTATTTTAATESRQAGNAPSPSITSTSSRSMMARGRDPGAANENEERCEGADDSVVDNDAAIARALAQEEADAEAKRIASAFGGGVRTVLPGVASSAYPGARNRGTGAGIAAANDDLGTGTGAGATTNCPAGCGLRPFRVPLAQAVRCNRCDRRLGAGETVHGCVSCDYDVCDSCARGGGAPAGGGGNDGGRDASPSASSAAAASALSPRPGVTAARGTPPRAGPPAPAAAAPPPFVAAAPPPHMCIVPCVLGDGVGVEMMVDSGAQLSVISLPLARELNLESRIDARHVGVAAGVGRARIAGKIHHVICSLGNVEFEMDFMVLDCADRLLLLGLDQMRKYKCIVDLENDRLVFGGHGGVEVTMLPPMEATAGDIANRSAMSSLGDQMGCPMM